MNHSGYIGPKTILGGDEPGSAPGWAECTCSSAAWGLQEQGLASSGERLNWTQAMSAVVDALVASGYEIQTWRCNFNADGVLTDLSATVK